MRYTHTHLRTDNTVGSAKIHAHVCLLVAGLQVNCVFGAFLCMALRMLFAYIFNSHVISPRLLTPPSISPHSAQATAAHAHMHTCTHRHPQRTRTHMYIDTHTQIHVLLRLNRQVNFFPHTQKQRTRSQTYADPHTQYTYTDPHT